MIVRDYREDDAGKICRLFYETVRSVNLKDYSPEQVRAWAPAPPDPAAWHGRMSGRHTLVAFLRDAVGRTHTDAVSIEVAGEATGIDLAVWDVSLNQGVNRSGAWELVNRPGSGQTVARYTGVDLVRHLPTAVRVPLLFGRTWLALISAPNAALPGGQLR